MVIRGVHYFPLTLFEDARGTLVSFEAGMNLPFAMRRFFLIKTGDAALPRAEHASNSEELLVVLSGAFECDVDNGEQRASIRLSAGPTALWLRPGVWLRLRDFAADTIIGVAASLSYADTVQTPSPMRDVLGAALKGARAG